MSNQEKAKEALESLQGEAKPFPWWNPREEVKGNVRLCISIPTYSNGIDLNLDSNLKQAFTSSLLSNQLEVTFSYMGGDSLICRARDRMAASFLDSSAEWQLQIDEDIIFPYGLGPQLARFYSNWMAPEIFNAFMMGGVFRQALSLNAIDEILRSGINDNKKIVGGLYFWRGGAQNFNEAASILPSGEGGGFSVDFKLRPDNYIDTDKLATGFLLTHRSVYEEIQKAFPELSYDVPGNIPGKPTYAFYTPMVTEDDIYTNERSGLTRTRFYRSEDYAFAWRAKQVGFEPCLNLNILLGHIGKHIYSWFDRPPLQKIILETFNHPAHHMEKIEEEKSDGT